MSRYGLDIFYLKHMFHLIHSDSYKMNLYNLTKEKVKEVGCAMLSGNENTTCLSYRQW